MPFGYFFLVRAGVPLLIVTANAVCFFSEKATAQTEHRVGVKVYFFSFGQVFHSRDAEQLPSFISREQLMGRRKSISCPLGIILPPQRVFSLASVKSAVEKKAATQRFRYQALWVYYARNCSKTCWCRQDQTTFQKNRS